MDPNATLRLIAAGRINSLACREAIANLAKWLASGGFPPRWEGYPTGARRFARRCPSLYAIEGKGPGAYATHPGDEA